MDELSIVEAFQTWMNWTEINFPKSGPKSSLIHLQEEIKEVLEAMDSDVPTFTSEEGITLMEYADCMICLITAAGKSGFTIEELFKAIKNKMEMNYKREWVLNANGTYSHVKK
jgi:NTP pyrophosphatase (non-canonical NTP hydrolase)